LEPADAPDQPAGHGPDSAPVKPQQASEASPGPEPPRRPSPPRPAPRKPESERPASASRNGADEYLLAAVLKELGIADQAGAVDPDDFAEQIGKVVRMVGEGLMQLLASRAEIKNEFRIDQTRIASSRNNPLKFSPSIEEAMRRVFVDRDSPGFISGAEAFELALNDLRAHQMAILAAVQGAVESVIRQFNPEELERKLKKISPISASAPLIREAKCWNLFTSHYEEMASNLRHDAKKVFVREFAEAYERSSSEIARRIAEDRDASAPS
ncbi:MAG: type VI secretion system-associated FHA domain protein TagH, partial [Wenzhouxiangella sp.]|nr:type VI secretion system-associated FHA domain protein TagH [Wenzhouxiangella sp.]